MENVRDYMFTLAAESVQRTDWVTEKVYLFHRARVMSLGVDLSASEGPNHQFTGLPSSRCGICARVPRCSQRGGLPSMPPLHCKRSRLLVRPSAGSAPSLPDE